MLIFYCIIRIWLIVDKVLIDRARGEITIIGTCVFVYVSTTWMSVFAVVIWVYIREACVLGSFEMLSCTSQTLMSCKFELTSIMRHSPGPRVINSSCAVLRCCRLFRSLFKMMGLFRCRRHGLGGGRCFANATVITRFELLWDFCAKTSYLGRAFRTRASSCCCRSCSNISPCASATSGGW